jgi:hypothetical protein
VFFLVLEDRRKGRKRPTGLKESLLSPRSIMIVVIVLIRILLLLLLGVSSVRIRSIAIVLLLLRIVTVV